MMSPRFRAAAHAPSSSVPTIIFCVVALVVFSAVMFAGRYAVNAPTQGPATPPAISR